MMDPEKQLQARTRSTPDTGPRATGPDRCTWDPGGVSFRYTGRHGHVVVTTPAKKLPPDPAAEPDQCTWNPGGVSFRYAGRHVIVGPSHP